MKNYVFLWQPCKNISDEAEHYKYFKNTFTEIKTILIMVQVILYKIYYRKMCVCVWLMV